MDKIDPAQVFAATCNGHKAEGDPCPGYRVAIADAGRFRDGSARKIRVCRYCDGPSGNLATWEGRAS